MPVRSIDVPTVAAGERGIAGTDLAGARQSDQREVGVDGAQQPLILPARQEHFWIAVVMAPSLRSPRYGSTDSVGIGHQALGGSRKIMEILYHHLRLVAACQLHNLVGGRMHRGLCPAGPLASPHDLTAALPLAHTLLDALLHGAERFAVHAERVAHSAAIGGDHCARRQTADAAVDTQERGHRQTRRRRQLEGDVQPVVRATLDELGRDGHRTLQRPIL